MKIKSYRYDSDFVGTDEIDDLEDKFCAVCGGECSGRTSNGFDHGSLSEGVDPSELTDTEDDISL